MEKYKLQYSKSFVEDYKKLSNQNKDLVDQILNREILESKYKDHELKGSLKGIRDCHIKPDLVLLYKTINDELTLIALRINSNSEVF